MTRPPRFSVVVPTYNRAHYIGAALDSVLAQTVPCTHVLVADGFPKPVVDEWDVRHMVLPDGHRDGGNIPRVLGGISALNHGFDAVAFLDADNWYQPDHLERMIDLHHATGAAVCTASRSMHRFDGTFMFDDDKGMVRIDMCEYMEIVEPE